MSQPTKPGHAGDRGNLRPGTGQTRLQPPGRNRPRHHGGERADRRRVRPLPGAAHHGRAGAHRGALLYGRPPSPTSTRRVPSITGRSWRPMSAAPYRGLKGGDGMTYEDIVMLIVAAVVFCLFSIVSTALFIKESDRCCRLRRENQKLRRLLEQRIQMDSDCLNAYCAMLREASRSDTRK